MACFRFPSQISNRILATAPIQHNVRPGGGENPRSFCTDPNACTV